MAINRAKMNCVITNFLSAVISRAYVKLHAVGGAIAFSVLTLGTLNAAENAAKVPSPQREFRAAWVATVANIDWPSKRGLTSSEQQRELLTILDRAVELNLNAIVFQVRPHCDALYASKLEPWSEYLTGKMGQPPKPFYDPLEFAVSEAHRRGLELHAWFNPYRALHAGSKGKVASNHVSQMKPQIVREYGKQQWLDPGEPEAADHSAAVILDVVRRYDVDGVHFDDYFYPYQIKDKEEELVPFPDEQSWQQAQAAGNALERDDWRRQHVNRFVQRVATEVHNAKSWVKFGISPFGIWRPGHPPQVKGYDAYASLYADAKKWWNEGWVDYLTPQLYWTVDSPGQCYPLLMQWWHQQNLKSRHLWPGNFTSRIISTGKRPWSPEEILLQIEHTRAHPGATGNVHFSMKTMLGAGSTMATALKAGPYQQPALVPATPWLGDAKPEAPEVAIDKTLANFSLPSGKSAWLWVVRTQHDKDWQLAVQPGHVRQNHLPALESSEAAAKIAVSAVNRLGIEGPITVLDLPQ